MLSFWYWLMLTSSNYLKGLKLKLSNITTGMIYFLLFTTSLSVHSIEQQGNALSSAIWSSSTIQVCWENLNDSTVQERSWVETAATNEWESVSSVDFTGWNQCTQNSQGIRIGVGDVGPHTKGLGRNLNGIPNGMVLNFTYGNWSTSCQTRREFCSRTIAVHEFGHALGFAHEQNRDDTPDTCMVDPQGTDGDTMIGAWDLDSVMNYCNPQWSGNGRLSLTDVQMVQAFYNDYFSPNYINTSSSGDFITADKTKMDSGSIADINGDNLMDYVVVWSSGSKRQLATYLSNSSGQFDEYINTSSSGYFIADKFGRDTGTFTDVNGDGLTDYVVVWSSNGRRQLATYLAKSDGTFHEYINTGSLGHFIKDSNGIDTGSFADINGDGMSDYVVIWNSSGKRQLATYLANRNGTFNEYINSRSNGSFIKGGDGRDTGSFADVNGDGLVDYVVVWNSGGKRQLATYLANRDGTFSEYVNSSSHGLYIKDTKGIDTGKFADINGDGLSDYVVIWNSNGKRQLATYLANSNGTFKEYVNTSSIASYIKDSFNRDTGEFSDINNDGLQDYVVVRSQNGIRQIAVYLGQSDGLFLDYKNTPVTGYFIPNIFNKDSGYLADFNGDGKSDYLVPWNSSNKRRLAVYLSN